MNAIVNVANTSIKFIDVQMAKADAAPGAVDGEGAGTYTGWSAIATPMAKAGFL